MYVSSADTNYSELLLGYRAIRLKIITANPDNDRTFVSVEYYNR